MILPPPKKFPVAPLAICLYLYHLNVGGFSQESVFARLIFRFRDSNIPRHHLSIPS